MCITRCRVEVPKEQQRCTSGRKLGNGTKILWGAFHLLPLRVKCPALYASETVPLTSQIYITVLLRRVAQFQPIPQQLVDSD